MSLPAQPQRALRPQSLRPFGPVVQSHRLIQPTTSYQPLDLDTRTISKQYFKLIQAIHHKEIVDRAIKTKSFPPGMIRQANKLTDFIKPSTPSESTRIKVHNNTMEWMNNNMHILQSHYSQLLDTFIHPIKNPLALQIAITWAQKRYGTRLTPATIQTTRNFMGMANPQPVSGDNNPPFATTDPPQARDRTPRPLTPILEEEDEEFPHLPTSKDPHYLTAQFTNSRTQDIQQNQVHDSMHPSSPIQSYLPPVETPHLLNSSSPATQSIQNQLNQDLMDWTQPLVSGTSSGTKDQRQTRRRPQQLLKSPDLADGHLHFRASTPIPIHSKGQNNLKDLFTPLYQTQDINELSISTIPPIKIHTTNTPVTPTSFTFSQQQVVDPTPHGEIEPSSDGDRRDGKREVQAQIHGPVDLTVSRYNPAIDICNQHPTNTNVATITDDLVLPASVPSTGDGEHLVDLTRGAVPPSPHGEITGFLDQEQRTSEMMTRQQKVILTDMSVSEPASSNSGLLGTAPLTQTKLGPSEASSIASSKSLPPPAPALIASSPISMKPTCHLARPHRKLQDWSFRVKRPVLILGDSNINRIPCNYNPNIQLDSYPGATIYHFLKICEKTPINPTTKIVVFSIGINNRDQDPKQTSIKQLKALYKQAQTTFPNAAIYFPIMNYSKNLTLKQQENLKSINNAIATYFSFLVELHHDQFQTAEDNIHWTPRTAEQIFHFWCEQLNLQLP